MSSTYDRMFPNQDCLTGKGLGNLIALPWQGQVGKEGHTLFLDPKTGYREPYENQAAVIEKALKTRITLEQVDGLISSWKLKKQPATDVPEVKGFTDAVREHITAKSDDALTLVYETVSSHGWDPGPINTDGKYHRFDTSKPGGKDGWIICSQKGDMVVATFGCWREGGKYTVSNKNGNRTAEENMFFQNHLADAEKQNEAVFKKAKKRAQSIWDKAQPVETHQYLETKGIQPHGARLYKGSIVIPVIGPDGEIVSLQFIKPDGTKKFLTGGRVSDGYERR